MENMMGPPNKRRRLLSSAQDFLQQSEAATSTPAPQFSHGVEHLQGPQATRTLKAKASPQHVEEVHLEIRNRPADDVGNGFRWFRRQGTAALTDAVSTSSESGADVALTAGVGILDASATAAVSADLPDVSSLLSSSTPSSTTSDSSVGPLSTGASSKAESDTSEPATSNASTPSSSSADESSEVGTGSSGVPLSTGAAASFDGSSQYGTGSTRGPLSTGTAASSEEASNYGTGSTRGSLPTGTAVSSSSSSDGSSQGGTGSSKIPLSTGTAPQSSSASPSSATISESSASSNGSVPVSSYMSAESQASNSIVAGTVSGYTASAIQASSSNRLNLTTSASVRTSGSVVFTSDYIINLASATSRSGSRTTDSSSSVDLAALFLATLSGGDVETFTRSDESFTTTLSDGQTATISPSSSRGSSTQGSSSRQSGSVTTISSDGSTVRSTVFSTATPSSTQSSSDDPNGVGIAGAAGEGATATSDGVVSSTATPDDSGDSDDGSAPAGTIAGGVVGGAAGLALVLVMVLIFLRRYKKRSQIAHRALPPNSGGMASDADPAVSSGGPGMAERAGLMPFAGAVPALFRHQNRNDTAGADTGERGFQRVSGRKLPSAFSEGMTGPPRNIMSPPPTMPLVSHDGNMDENAHGQAPYRDSVGFYGATDSPTSADPFSDNNAPAAGRHDGNAENLTMSPGPQRTPTIHAARPDVQNPSVATSGTPSWTPSSAAAFARSDTPASLDGSRNSRFTEEV